MTMAIWNTRQGDAGQRDQRDRQSASSRISPRGPSNGGAAWTSGADAERLSRALGWFSVGLGLAEVAAPGTLARFIGVPARPTMMRLFGLREIASGVGILAQRRPAPWVWARVAGDVLDLAALGAALASPRARQGRVVAAAAAVAGVSALDVLCGRELSRSSDTPTRRGGASQGMAVAKTVAVDRSPEELYRFWRDFPNLSRIMKHVESVEVLDDRRTRWRARGPAGQTVEWEAELVEDRPGEMISWRSLPGSAVETSGSMRFARAAAGRGTAVRVEMQYRPPGGALGALLAKLFGTAPEQTLHTDLMRWKQLMETGEIATTTGQPSARTTERVARGTDVHPTAARA
jgi:uncharacterized membrane protein